MKKLFITTCAILMFWTNVVHADRCLPTSCTGSEHLGVSNTTANCKNVYKQCYDGQFYVMDCTQCNTGAELVSLSHDPVFADCTGVVYHTCECKACSNCTSGPWTAYSTGYERRLVKTCNCGTCNSSYSYRCAAGYYGSTTNGTSGCTRCPAEDNAQGTSSAGSTAKTSCYIPNGTSFSNTSGKGSFAGNSYFCN